jgi:soluble lytic murein transglycosylase
LKLTSIEASLSGGTRLSGTTAKPTPAPVSTDLEASAEEIEIVNRMTIALKSGDLVPAVEDGMKLIGEFPGGTRAKWATDRIEDVYLSLGDKGGDKGEEKFLLLREKVLKLMEKADADRLAEWARIGYNRGLYEDALRLSRRSLDSMSDAARSTKTYGLAAEAALHVDKFDIAKGLYQILINKHAGTPFAREALLRVGLIEYRQKNYQLAMAAFERLLVLPGTEKFELTARHWLWRSLQKVKEDARAQEQAQILITKFPFSYYGLRARVETQKI